MITTLKQIVDVQKSNQSQLEELSTAFAQLIEGMGITQQMEVHKSKTNESDKKPIYAEDMEKVLEFLEEKSV